MNPMPSLSADQSLTNIQNVLSNAEFQLLQAKANLVGAQAAAGALGSDSQLKASVNAEIDQNKAQVARHEAIVDFYRPLFEEAKEKDEKAVAAAETVAD